MDFDSAARQSALAGVGRRTIGLLIGQGTGSYDHGLYEGVRAAAQARDLNVVNLMCGSLDSTLWNPFEGQNNLLFNLPSRVVFDGLLLIPSILYNYATPERAEQILACYRDIPMVTISQAIPGRPALFADNCSGVREVVRHVHDRHGRRRFAFIAGPSANNDTADRLRGFRQGVEDCGLAFEPDMVFEGNYWWTGGRDGAKHFFAEGGPKPDALICANDYMAYGASDVLKALALRIPEDVVLTGFDNDQDSIRANPPLTTIEQPLDAMAERAVEVISAMIEGRRVEPRTVLPTRTVYRRSCGCHSGVETRISTEGWEAEFEDDELRRRMTTWVETATKNPPGDVESRSVLLDSFYELLSLAGERGKLARVRTLVPALLDANLDERARADRAFRDGVQAVALETREAELGVKVTSSATFKEREAQAIQNIISVSTLDEMFDRLVDELPTLGVTSLFLNLYPKPFEHRVGERWSVPSKARCVFAYIDGERLTLPRSAAVLKTDRLVPEAPRLSTRRRNLISISCFFRTEVYGFMVVEATSDDMVVLGNLATHISSAYRSILGYQKLEESAKRLELALRQLQSSNRELNTLSTRDALTGLYNRRGFEFIGEKLHELTERNQTDYVLFFGDMDGLKAINDTWGHKAGDDAIVSCADILRRTFRSSDLVARLGGDEFTILAAESERQSPARLMARLEAALRRHNETSGHPYRLDLSIGYVLFSECRGLPFAEVMARADEELYRQKTIRKRAAS